MIGKKGGGEGRGGGGGENEHPANFLLTKNLFVSISRRTWLRSVCVKDPGGIFYRLKYYVVFVRSKNPQHMVRHYFEL